MCTAGFGEPLAFSLRARQLLAAAPRRVRRGPRQPVPRHGHARHGRRRLAAADHAAPPDHRRPPARPVAHDQPLAALHARAAGSGSSACRCGWRGAPRRGHGVAESPARTSRRRWACAPERMTVVPVGVDHTVFRPFDDVTPVPGRIMVTSCSDVPMKGLVPAARGGGQAAHRARRRADGHRPPRARAAGSTKAIDPPRPRPTSCAA